MEKITLRHDVRFNRYIYFLALNAIFLIAALLFCEVKYEVSDDFVMETILSGAYGEAPNAHMLFVNYIYGMILKPFYLLWPGINWYTISLLFWGFSACCGVGYLMYKSMSTSMALFFNLIFLVFFTNDIYILLQFTKTASLCCGTGALLVFHGLFGVENREIERVFSSKSEFAVGAILCIVGSLIRLQTIYLVAPFIVVLIISVVLTWYRLKNKIKEKQKVKVLVMKVFLGFVLIVAVYTCKNIDNSSYADNAEYQYYKEYAETRADIVDSADYDYEEYKADFQEIGITENDYQMIRKWNFSDSEYFPLEKLQQVAEIINTHNKNMERENLYNDIVDRKYGSYPIVIACIIIFIICLLWNAKSALWYLASLCSAGVIIYYFFMRKRVLYRLEFGIFLMCFLLIMYFAMPGMKSVLEDIKWRKAVAMINVCCLIWHIPVYIADKSYNSVEIEYRKDCLDEVFNESGDYDEKKYRKKVNEASLEGGLIEEMKSHPERVYMLDFSTTIQSLYYDWSAFDSLGVGYYDNFCYISGVTMNFPDVNNCLKKMGINNTIKDLVNDNVYLVDNKNSEHIVAYLQEHYYSDAWIELVSTIEGYNIWKIHSE